MFSDADLDNLHVIDLVAENEGELIGYRLFTIYDWATDNDWLKGDRCNDMPSS